MQAPLVMPRVATRYRSCYNNYFQNIPLETFPKNLFYYLLFIKVNPEAIVCPNFNLTLMVNFTLIPLFNY